MRNKKVFVLCVILMFCLTSTVLAQDVLLRDDWLVIEEASIPIGYGNDQFWKTSEGYYYRSFFQISMDFFGTPFVYLESIDIWTDLEFRLTSVLRVSDADGAQTRHEAKFVYGPEKTEVYMEISDHTGKTAKSYFNWEGVKPIYSSSSLVDKARAEGRLVVGHDYTFETWDYGQLSEVVFTVVEETEYEYEGSRVPVFLVMQETDTLTQKVLIDKEGVCYNTETLGENIAVRKVSPDNLPEIQSKAADALVVPGNIVVEHPFRAASSVNTVRWSDVKPNAFCWEDNRQTVANVLDDTTVQLRIRRDDRDFSGRVQLPVEDIDFAKYLGDEDYITPSLPIVQELAAEILQGEQDGWKATQLLVNWVFQNMTSEMVVQTLTTAEILEGRVGKCSEYAILFAAMARAAGLPTRIALGERYQGSLWIGHMWNEVWLGEWVAVDASHNQIAPDALLIKFVDSETVMGTQDVRIGLIGKLDIVIDDFEVPAVTEDLGLETGIYGDSYVNREYACEISIPEGWMSMEGEDQGFPMLVMYDPLRPEESAVLLMMSLPPGIRPNQLMASRIAALPNVLPDFTLVCETSETVNQEEAAVGRWTFSNNPVLVQENWIVIREDVGYLFVFTAPEVSWSEFQPKTVGILDTFISHL